MPKHNHEVRDPIHVFIRLDSEERKVLNSRPVQRLRHIHQLAMTSLIYPGATHRRFEHSLGVMELAGRVYDVVTHPANIGNDAARAVVPPPGSHQLTYWRRVVRMAALCHDIGHLPFSHAAEAELLPTGWDHERLTVELIRGQELRPVWSEIKVQPEDVAKLAVGAKKYKDAPLNDWEALLAEIIVGNAFGVDRIDYLLRDSHHAGVAYGRFDHFRLIDTIRILPKTIGSEEPTLGVEEGGLHSAEALLLARFFMYTQLYFHPIRRVYDIHLKNFLQKWLPGGTFSTRLEDHLNLTDNEVMAAILTAARDAHSPGHDEASRLVDREHYRTFYQRNPDDVAINPESAKAIFEAACGQFGDTFVHWDSYKEKNRGLDFPVLARDGRIVSSLSLSDTLKNVPVVAVDFVFIAPHLRTEAERWLREHREEIITPRSEEAT
jgi:HD superfamily phosphohydrolase